MVQKCRGFFYNIVLYIHISVWTLPSLFRHRNTCQVLKSLSNSNMLDFQEILFKSIYPRLKVLSSFCSPPPPQMRLLFVLEFSPFSQSVSSVPVPPLSIRCCCIYGHICVCICTFPLVLWSLFGLVECSRDLERDIGCFSSKESSFRFVLFCTRLGADTGLCLPLARLS